MSGYIKIHRGWRDNAIFKGEFSRGEAWIWLIENAAWKPTKARIKGSTVDLDRGELTFSQRFLAEKWGWSKSRVDRFLADLRDECMIETRSKIGAHSGATAGHSAGQGQSIIRLCNYNKYQVSDEAERGDDDTDVGAQSGASAGQQRGNSGAKKEEGKKERREEEGGGAAAYAFFGKTIRLNDRDFGAWKGVYHAIPDLNAELITLDAWWQGQDDPRPKNWFYRTSQMLNRKHQELLRAPSDAAQSQHRRRETEHERQERERREWVEANYGPNSPRALRERGEAQ